MPSLEKVKAAILLLLLWALPAEAIQPSGMDLVAQNAYLSLFIHPETTEIALWDREADVYWFSNPQGRNMRQGVGHDVVQIRYDAPTSPDKLMNSYTHSVELGQAAIFPLDEGVRVEYLFGSAYDPSSLGVPQMVKAGRFQAILQKVASSDQETLLRHYTPICLRDPYPFELKVTAAARSLEERLFGSLILVPCTKEYEQLLQEAQEAKEQRTLAQLEEQLAKARMDALYGLLEKFTGYLLGSGEGARSAAFRQDITTAADLEPADFAHLRDEPSYLLGRLAPLLQEQVQRIFAKVGYDLDDLTGDHVSNRLDPPIPLVERFFVPVEYRLEERTLTVRIPMDEVVYPQDQPTSYEVNWDGTLGEELLVYDQTRELVTYPLTSVALLRFFGAADSTEEGYIFVPDGSGALIYLNNGKTNQTLYSEPVYGRDGALPIGERLPYEKKTNHLPVFGMKRGNQAFLAVIEEGEALAQIRADIARPASRYNVAYAAFQTIFKSARRLDQFTQINLYQTRAYQGDLKVRYAFLYGEEANYSGMARLYQDYLLEQGTLARKPRQEGTPFFLEVLGVVPKTQPILGIAREVELPLTSFVQAQEMVEDLLDQGITHLQLRYAGWLRGGVRHQYPNGLRLAPSLGGRAELTKLTDFLQEHHVPFYPAVEFLQVNRSGILQGFQPRRDAARAISGLYATLPNYDLVTNLALSEGASYLLSPRSLPALMADFMHEFEELGITGLALPSMGQTVHSDLQRDPSRVIDRMQAADQMAGELEKLEERGLKLQVDGGNALALPYVASILNLPQKSTGFNLCDGEIPFLQMVLHGFVDYAGEPLNLAADPRESVLRSAQTASGLYLKLMAADPAVLKETEYSHFLSVQGDYWLKEGVRIYQEYNAELGDLAQERIVEFKQVRPDLSVTYFESGDGVLVNFGSTDRDVDGTQIPARSFVRLRGVR